MLLAATPTGALPPVACFTPTGKPLHRHRFVTLTCRDGDPRCDLDRKCDETPDGTFGALGAEDAVSKARGSALLELDGALALTVYGEPRGTLSATFVSNDGLPDAHVDVAF